MIEQIRDLLKDKNKKSWVSMIKRRDDMLSVIKQLYPNYPLNESLFLIVKNINPPIAPCGNKCKFENGEYTSYCQKPTRPNKDKNNGYCIICNEEWNNKKQKTTKQNCLEEYGVEYHWQRSEVKDKIKKTNLERYGVEHNSLSTDVIEKRKKTFLKNYGVDTPLKSTLIKNKIKATNVERYGVENYGSTKECIEKRKNTMIERYGVSNPSQSPAMLHKTKIKLAKSRYDTIIEKNKHNSKFTILFEWDDLIDCDNETLLPYYCEEHGLFYSSYKYKIICSTCTPNSISTTQQEVIDFLTSLGLDIEINVRNVIDKELDIYIPSKGIAFEVNGMYWHSTLFRNETYHQDKMKKCIEKKIHLIQIWEDDWNTKRTIVKSRIQNILGISDRLFARKCSIREITSNECAKFVNMYHIQGNVNCPINIGLYYNEELMAVMNFKKSRYDKNIQYELIRYCSKNTIVGGASKLLTYFENVYNPESIVSYADACWSTGNLYEKLGFENKGLSRPGYFYFSPTKGRISRNSVQKHKLVEMGYDKNLTEEEICTNILKYNKIYDCGNLKFTKYYR